ncbi:hypothetical protein ACFQPG_10920 [Sphingomonas sp. GCM10030256]|uniref:hypothetical protein n=1 Tax=Sphingomonas sp. GCM10030256 TaxID=3273427 RepID=UPI003607D02F
MIGINAEAEHLAAKIKNLQSEIARLQADMQPPQVHRRSSHSLDGTSIRKIIRARRSREAIFDRNLLSDPAWEILLEAYAASAGNQRISVSGLCLSSGAPESTAARWVKKLEQDHWLVRIQDPLDRRRCWMELSDKAHEAMDRYFATLAEAFASSSASSTNRSSR